MTWLLRGRGRRILAEMQYILTRSKPNPKWKRWASRDTAIWCLPDAFVGTGEEGIEAARELLAEEGFPSQRTGLLVLGLAGRGSCQKALLTVLEPFLAHANGAVRDAAVLATGFVFQRGADRKVLEALQKAHLGDRRGPSTNYPLAVGLLYQGSGDEEATVHLAELFDQNRRRLAHYAALGIGLIYQGTAQARGVEQLLPMLEQGELDPTCIALQMIDFDAQTLEALPRDHGVADGPGSARVFVVKHFVDSPPNLSL